MNIVIAIIILLVYTIVMIKIGGSIPPIFICYGRCNRFYSINIVIVISRYIVT